MATDKDTIYVDIDDEITGIIDKLKASDGKVVALVLPKRAGVFQSIVNMKLLKRAADDSKKNLVLITSEAGLLPLAGAAGIHVAKTLTSKPEIPAGPGAFDDSEEMVDEATAEPMDQPIDSTKPVGELAGGAAAGAAADEGVETIALDDDEPSPEEAAAGPVAAKTFEPPKKKNKKFKIPNFERFRLLLALGILLLILLIGGLIFASVVLPKAIINIKTDATNLDVNQDLNLSTTATQLDPSSNTVPAKLEQQQKTYTQQVPTTGQKNNGSKAQGSITMSGQTCGTIPNGPPNDVPAGTGVSANGQTYITQEDTSFSYSGGPKHNCLGFQSDNPTPIVAQSAGANSNTPNGTSFTVAGRSDLSASGSASGGTDNIVQSVNQNDINNAKSKISAANDSQMKQALDSQTKGDGLYPIDVTFNAGTPNVTPSASVGDVASTVTVTETITYTMFGVHKDDLTSIIDGNIRTQIDVAKQSILDDGLGAAIFNVNNQAATSAALSMSTKAVVGPHLDSDSIKSNAAGKRVGEIKGQLSSNPDVTNVDVKLSPFWISSAPKKTNRITVNIAKPTTTAKSSSNGSNKP